MFIFSVGSTADNKEDEEGKAWSVGEVSDNLTFMVIVKDGADGNGIVSDFSLYS